MCTASKLFGLFGEVWYEDSSDIVSLGDRRILCLADATKCAWAGKCLDASHHRRADSLVLHFIPWCVGIMGDPEWSLFAGAQGQPAGKGWAYK